MKIQKRELTSTGRVNTQIKKEIEKTFARGEIVSTFEMKFREAIWFT